MKLLRNSNRFLPALALLAGTIAAIFFASPNSCIADSHISSYRKAGLVIPHIVVNGIEKYHFSGAEEGVNIWLQYGGPQIRAKANAYIDALHNAENLYGKFVNYHLLKNKQLSPSTALVYVVLNYERGPMFARFLVYKYKSNEYVPEIEFSLIPEAIFPETLTD